MTIGGRVGRQLLSIGALAAAVAVAMVLLSPSRPQPVGTPEPTRTALSPAEEYARTALQIMGDRSFFVDEVTWWPGVVRDAMAQVRPARSAADTYPALTTALAATAGPQGLLVAPKDVPTPEIAAPPAVSASGGIAHITVPTIGPLISDSESTRATAIADTIRTSRPAVSCGWVIDLRDTRSQDDWGLLAGLHQFLPEGEIFQLRDRNGKAFHVSIAMGSVFLSGRPMASASGSGTRNTQPVAVLQSGQTTGVGEALTLALQQSDRTRTFGTDTRGLPLTERFALPDGAELVLPTTRLTDLAGHDFTHGIPPQARTDDPDRAAVDWLRSQCRRR